MQINHANSFTPQTAPTLGVDNNVRVNEQRDRLVVERDLKKNEKSNQQSQSQAQQQTRFDVDEQSIALVEQAQQNKTFAQSKDFSANSSSTNTGYDQPSQANQTAVSAYQSVGNIAERDNIAQAFGVDLYA